MKCLIITPTYNESENIEKMIGLVFEKTAGVDLEMLIVDDGSPDGTAAIVKRLAAGKFAGRLHLLERAGKQGLATAYIAGFKWGIGRGCDVLVEMDADLSHNPDYLRPMIRLTETHDVVVGSRNVKGGGVRGWGPVRTITSRGGSFYARLILGVPVRDLTGGFNVWKRGVLERIGLDSIISRGYSFQIELKYRASRLGFKVVDFPIVFENRTEGKSKMSKKIFFEAILNVWKLKFIDIG